MSRSPTVLLSNRAWIPIDHVTDRLLKAYSYKTTQHVQDEDGAWNEEEFLIELPVWNRRRTHLGFPRGDLKKLLAHWTYPKIVDHRSIAPLGFALSMLDHVYADERWKAQQRLLTRWLKCGGGVIKSPAASGKSVLALAAICSLSMRSIVLFDRRDFRDQWLKELYRHTDIKDWESKLGVQLAGIFQGDEIWPITFTTYQRLASKRSRKALKNHRDYFGLVIVDEVHHASAPVMRKRIGWFNPLTHMGVTATPERKDQLQYIYYDFMGPVIAESDAEQMIPIVYIHPTGFEVSENRWKADFAQFGHFLSQICNSKERNHLICKWVTRDVEHGRCVLVVSERVKHCYELQRMLTSPQMQYGLAPSRVAVAVGSVRNRDQIYEDIQNMKYDVLIASKLIDEGVNIPRLDTLHLATPLAAKPRTEQRVGRIRRPMKGKLRPKVRDYVDGGHGMIYGAARAREIVYDKIGAELRHKGIRGGSLPLNIRPRKTR